MLLRNSDHWAFQPCSTEQHKCSSSWPWNRNGKRNLNPTVMDFDQDVPVMMPFKRSILASTKNPSMCWMLILPNALIASLIVPYSPNSKPFPFQRGVIKPCPKGGVLENGPWFPT